MGWDAGGVVLDGCQDELRGEVRSCNDIHIKHSGGMGAAHGGGRWGYQVFFEEVWDCKWGRGCHLGLKTGTQ